MTLPLIYALRNSEKKEQRRILKIIKKYNKDKKKVQEVVEFVKAKKGIEYSIEKMNEYKDKAKAILSEFPENEASKSLSYLMDYITARKK